ncbi:MAG: hypothetical protein DWQ02_14810 [Bacteroidetes bacterium]|nr:MAG: hypothetical protein DWQ02_14810 [Bacteroidota bacterium]
MKYFTIIGALLVSAFFLASCNKTEDFITDSSAKLSFSLDTLRFDTVFTSLGSATRSFKVYNEYDQPIRITNVQIEGNSASVFRMNVDGTPGTSAESVEIWPNDSIYIFVEVTIDPDQPVSASPFIVEDKVIFETNGNTQQVYLEAWGQNAVYLPSRFNKGVRTNYKCEDGKVYTFEFDNFGMETNVQPTDFDCPGGEWTFDDSRPYVLYGEIFLYLVDLKLPPGTDIHVHGGIAQNEDFGVFNDGILYVTQTASIEANGTLEDPIIIQGDRLEEGFSEVSAQWYGIFLGKGSTGNSFDFTTIKNSTFSLFVDSLATVDLNNSQFYNTASSALIAYHSAINAQNCLIYNNGSNSVELRYGGEYSFEHCTIANFGTDNPALAMTNWACLQYDQDGNCVLFDQNRLEFSMINSIATGSRRDHIIFSDWFERQDPNAFVTSFRNCITRVDDLLTTSQNGIYSDFFETICFNCINPELDDALFVDRSEDDFHLDTLSIAIDQGLNLTGIPLDIEGNPRIDASDIGCYEYQK